MGNGTKIGLRVIMYYGLMLLISLLFLSSLTGWMLYVLNAMLLIGFFAIILNDGGYEGEKAASMKALIEKQRSEGHVIDEKMEKQSFSKKHVAGILLVTALPMFLLAAVNLACEPFYPEVEMVTEETEDAEETETESEDGFSYDENAFPEADIEFEEEDDEETSPITYLMVLTRALFMPFVGLYSLVSAHVLYILFLPLSLIYPMICVAGYLQGPKLREKKLKDIEKGKKRKMRNLRVNKKPKGPKQMKPEV